MGDIISGVTDAVGLTDTKEAGDAAKKAAAITAGAQQEGLDYLKGEEALPRQLREGALSQLGGLYGLEGGTGSQQQLIDQAMRSPMYTAIMGGQEAGEEAILRNAGATGGLRSGNVQAALATQATQLQNQALSQSYNQQLQGLQGMSGLPSYARDIASGTAGIGRTFGQGLVAQKQADLAAQNQLFEDLMGIGKIGAGAFG